MTLFCICDIFLVSYTTLLLSLISLVSVHAKENLGFPHSGGTNSLMATLSYDQYYTVKNRTGKYEWY